MSGLRFIYLNECNHRILDLNSGFMTTTPNQNRRSEIEVVYTVGGLVLKRSIDSSKVDRKCLIGRHLDDILDFRSSLQKHPVHLNSVCHRLRKVNL